MARLKLAGVVLFVLAFGVVGTVLLRGGKAENKDNYLFDASGTPAKVDSGDGKAVELGVKFKASLDGYVRGIRFYKATSNTGEHTGTLWSATGVKLATGTFVNESASGWQRLTFPRGVKITANTTYVASYYAPAGHYSANYNFFTQDFKRITLTAPSSASSAGNGVFKYGPTSSFPTDTASATNYWVEPIYNRDFSTIVNLLTGTPTATSTDTRPVEVGTRFTTEKPGKLLTIGFYQASTDTGSHTATLWSATGTKLGSATFPGGNVGWNRVNFANPIALAANTEYIVSVYIPSGRYTYTPGAFAAAYHNPPLHAPVNAGAYIYGSGGIFPKNFGSTSYFVQPTVGYADSTSTTPSPPPPSSSGAPTSGPMPYSTSGSRHLYVSKSGKNTTGESWTEAYTDISTAAGAATAGTVIHVANGEYPPVTSTRSGLSSAPIIFVSESKYGAKINADGHELAWENTGDYVHIVNFELFNSTKSGIKSTASYGKFLGNRIYNVVAPRCAGGAGIELENYRGTKNDSIGNEIHHVIISPSAPPEDQDCAKNHGIYYQGPDGGRIANNLVYDTSGWGIHLYHNPTNTIVTNNTVLYNKKGGIVIGAAHEAGDVSGAYARGMKVYNNIVAYNQAAGIREVGSWVGGNIYKYNLLWQNADAPFALRTSGSELSTETNNITNKDPQMKNYQPVSGGDYRLRLGSPAINAGIASEGPDEVFPYDIIYVPRPFSRGYDIGAYEGGY